ncbi:MAG: hypothetical protein Q9219_006678 [cf. Caloplaca sp. 3 TL-2023]
MLNWGGPSPFSKAATSTPIPVPPTAAAVDTQTAASPNFYGKRSYDWISNPAADNGPLRPNKKVNTTAKVPQREKAARPAKKPTPKPPKRKRSSRPTKKDRARDWEALKGKEDEQRAALGLPPIDRSEDVVVTGVRAVVNEWQTADRASAIQEPQSVVRPEKGWHECDELLAACYRGAEKGKAAQEGEERNEADGRSDGGKDGDKNEQDDEDDAMEADLLHFFEQDTEQMRQKEPVAAAAKERAREPDEESEEE